VSELFFKITSVPTHAALAIALAGCIFASGCGNSKDAANAAKLDGANASSLSITDGSSDERAPQPPFDLVELPRERGVTIEDGDAVMALIRAVRVHSWMMLRTEVGDWVKRARLMFEQDKSCPSELYGSLRVLGVRGRRSRTLGGDSQEGPRRGR
jgi:hypothetical protein